jgi:hypothetical protein
VNTYNIGTSFEVQDRKRVTGARSATFGPKRLDCAANAQPLGHAPILNPPSHLLTMTSGTGI